MSLDATTANRIDAADSDPSSMQLQAPRSSEAARADAVKRQGRGLRRRVGRIYESCPEVTTDRHPNALQDDADELKIIDLPIFRPTSRPSGESLAAMQEWEGVITEVCDGIFYADLVDVTAGASTPNETAEIPVEEVSEEDLPRVVPGAVFRWAVGYLRTQSAQRITASVIYFRRTSARRSADAAQQPTLDFEDRK